MKNIVILSAFLLALGTLVGTASDSATVAAPIVADVFTPMSLPVNPNLPIENYQAI